MNPCRCEQPRGKVAVMALDNIGTIVAEMNTVSTIQSPLAPLRLLREYTLMQWQAQAQST